MDYGPSLEDHLIHLSSTLEMLRKHNLYTKSSKCYFGQEKVEYLGHLNSQQGVKVNPNKIYGMIQWTLPTTIKVP